MMRIFMIPLLLTPILHAAEPDKLFNGVDFDGWTFDIIDPEVQPDALWRVENGILICKGRPPGVMRSLKDYENYELVIEWRWPVGKKPGNSGVLVHAGKPRERFIWPKSIEVQLRADDAGDFWMIGESVTVADKQAEDRRFIKSGDSAEKPIGEWNTMKIRCEKDTITVHVNGTLMNHGTALTATNGAICLQSESGEIHFRKVELTPLKAVTQISEDSR